MQHDARAELENRLSGLWHLLQRMEGLQQQKDAIYNQHARRYVPYQNRWGAGAYWVCCAILCPAMILTGAFTLDYWQQVAGGAAGFIAGAFVLAPFPLAGIIVGIHNVDVPRVNAKREMTNQQVAERIAEVVAPEVQPIDDQLHEAWLEFQGNYSGFFPENYLSTQDVGAIWQIVHNHRAATVPDAINLYLADQHAQYMRDAANLQIAEQQRATRVTQMGFIMTSAMIATRSYRR